MSGSAIIYNFLTSVTISFLILRFLATNDGELEDLAWWPQDPVYLDDEAKELQKKYLGT